MNAARNRSWVDGANSPHGFGLNHLPYGAFRKGDATHLCVRIGDRLLDLHACAAGGLLDLLSGEVRQALQQPTLNALLALGSDAWQSLRNRVVQMLGEYAPGDVRARLDSLFHPVEGAELVLPIEVPGYTDFYSSLHHARRVGELFRPDQPLLPNYKHVPIAYNGRASSIVVSGTPVQRPWGQYRPAGDRELPELPELPTFDPTAALDYEIELAFVIGAGNALGEPISIDHAREAIFGVALLNDWSARDVQAWEYQPLGPFLGKSFATSVSPWITPLAALDPFRVPVAARAAGDPRLLPYLWSDADQSNGALDLGVEVSISTEASRSAGVPPMTISRANARELYWTAAQMVAHHTGNGCNLRPGDLLATGTISGAERLSAGCLLELARNGQQPLPLPNGERRTWLEDGDEIILTARCERQGTPPIALGGCTGRVFGARRSQ